MKLLSPLARRATQKNNKRRHIYIDGYVDRYTDRLEVVVVETVIVMDVIVVVVENIVALY